MINQIFSIEQIQLRWTRFWMHHVGLKSMGRFAALMAAVFAKPHKARDYLARMNRKGFISHRAVIHHGNLHLGHHIFMDDRVVVFQNRNGGAIELGNGVCLYRDVILETGFGGSLRIGNEASIHPRCQLNAYVTSIEIGDRVMIAPSCGLYSYNHGVAPGQPIVDQPVTSRGSIIVGDDAWIGFGAIVLESVKIGKGAVIGAGSVVTRDIPDGAIAAGNPARVIKMRSDG